MNSLRATAALLILAVLPTLMARPTIIAHRGASGYLPEHTLESAAYAHALGADFVEQDVVMSQDGVLIVCHDIHIDTTTDVAQRFPTRARTDGRFYAIDFTWEELRSLQVRERFDPATGRPVFPQRFPANGGAFRLCTMEEQIKLVQGLNQSTGRTVGIYPEIKEPAWHAREGQDPARALLALLSEYGYTRASDPVFVQCFDPVELKRLRFELGTALRLIQLLEPPQSGLYDQLVTPAGLAEIATYAQGIGPAISQLRRVGARNEISPTSLVAEAHAAGLLVHAYTFRADALPPGVRDLAALLEELVVRDGVDGCFTDHPDRATSLAH